MPFRGWMRRARSALKHPADGPSSQPELTVTAVVIGLLIGCLLCFTNLYFGLQTGWISMMSLQSALIGFLVSRLLPPSLIKSTPQTTVIIQTTAVATGTMPLAAGFVGILPALSLLNEAQDGRPPIELTWLGTAAWCCAVAYFGVFLSPPIRKQVIIAEKLAFPSGTATAQLISVLHGAPPARERLPHKRKGYTTLSTTENALGDPSEETGAAGTLRPSEELDRHLLPSSSSSRTGENDDVSVGELNEGDVVKKQGWTALGWSFLASSILTLAAYFFPVLFAIPLFGQHLAKEWLWTFTPSLSYVGQGIIMGFPTTVSMSLGAFVGWAILSPLAKHNGWAPGPTGDMASGARGWILWVSLAIMCADSVVSLIPVMWSYVTSRIALRRNADTHSRTAGANEDEDEDEDPETEDRLVPMSWVAWGLGGSVVLGVALIWVVFEEKPWATFVGFLAGSLLSVLGVRALGETDLNPVSGLGKISQLLFAVLQPGNVVANIVAGGVAEAGAQQAGDLMQDLKTGHLLHASPRAQFWGQLIGSTLSIMVTTTAYGVYKRAYEIPGPSFPAPTAYVWLSLARLLRDGTLPQRSKEYMLFFALLFGVLAALKTRGLRSGASWAPYIPSGVAFAIGFLNTPSFSLARLVGGAVEYAWRRRMERTGRERDIRLIVVASGFVLGEGVSSVFTLALKTWGVGVMSCVGCGTGMCSGCRA